MQRLQFFIRTTLASLVTLLLFCACVPTKKNLVKIRVAPEAVEPTPAPILMATLSNTPSNPSSALSLNVSVAGDNIAEYQYVVIDQVSTCALATYSGWISIATAITDSVADGNKRLCVKGRNASGSLEQISATQWDWVQLAGTPVIVSFQLRDSSNASATLTDSKIVDAVFVSVSGTVGHYCATLSSSTPSIGDSCWGTSSTATTTIMNSSSTIYAWARYGLNISSAATDTIKYATGICDDGDLDATSSPCYIRRWVGFSDGSSVSGSGTLIIDAGGSFNTSSTNAMTINMGGDLTLQYGGKIFANLTELRANNLIIDSTGTIDVSSLGYQGVNAAHGNGINNGHGRASNAGSGGGYGGFGGEGFANDVIGGPYGSTTTPSDYGSAGGGSVFGSRGGHGGGKMKLVITGAFTLDGSLLANGDPGQNAGGSRNGGGGSGGSIWIIAGSMSGSGTISANGGSTVSNTSQDGGGGGGGRIAIDTTSLINGISVQALGGSTYDQATPGQTGTVYLTNSSNYCTSGSLSGACTLTRRFRFLDGDSLSGVDLTIDSGGIIELAPLNAMSISMSGNVILQNGAKIIGSLNELSANNLTIDGTSFIDVSELGYQGIYTASGQGIYGGQGISGNAGAGGGNGGRGGNGQFGSLGGASYGSKLAPINYGSAGGGSAFGSQGGDGGGKVKLNIINTLTLDGYIKANGGQGENAGGTRTGGGGAGGSVWLMANTFAGNGYIQANGNSPDSDVLQDGGGGGGGRVALQYESRSFIGNIDVKGGLAYGAGEFGAVGTLCLNGSGPLCGPTVKSGLMLWLSADAGITKDGSNNITSWRDQSGYSTTTNLVATSSDPQWVVGDSYAGGQAYIDFDGNDMLQAPIVGSGITSSTNYTFFVVGKHDDTSGTRGMFTISAGSTAGTTDLAGVGVSAGFNSVSFLGSGVVLAHTSLAMDNNPQIIMTSYSPGLIRLGLNGTDIYSATSTLVGYVNPTQDINVGGGDNNGALTYFIDGRVYEIIAYNRDLPASERQQVEGYLAAKYDLPIAATSSMLAWYRADKGLKSDGACTTTQSTDAGAVNCWQDQSGHNNDATAPGTAPSLSVSDINKKPGLNFVSAQLQTGTMASSTRSITAVLKRATSSAPAALEIPWRAVNTSRGAYWYTGIDTGLELNLVFNTSSTPYSIGSTGDAAATTTGLVISGNLDSYLELYNSGKVVQTTPANHPLHDNNILSMGAESSALTYPFDGSIAELFAHGSGMSYFQQGRLENYLAQKYALNYTPLAPLNASGMIAWWSADRGIVSDQKSAQFVNANTEYLTIADNAALSTGNVDFSVAAWVYIDAFTGTNMNIITKYGGQDEYFLMYYPTTSRFMFGVDDNLDEDDGGIQVVEANNLGAPGTGRWYFIVAWHDSVNDQIGMVVNDLAAETTPYSLGAQDGTSNFSIGGMGAAGSGRFNGRIANVGFWKNRVLSSADIRKLYNKGHGLPYQALDSGLKTNLTSYWNLDEASGTRNDSHSTNHLTDMNTVTQASFEPGMSMVTTWLDQSGHGNHATQSTASLTPILVLDSGTSVNNRPVVRFDGTGDLLNLTRRTNSNLHTVFVVAKNNDAVNGSVILGDPSAVSPLMAIASNQIAIAPDAGFSVGSTVASMTNWYIMTAKSNGSTYYSYENGGDQQSVANTNSFTVNSIGGYSGTSYDMDGDIAEIIIYKQNLSTTEKEAVECYLSAKYNIALLGITCP